MKIDWKSCYLCTSSLKISRNHYIKVKIVKKSTCFPKKSLKFRVNIPQIQQKKSRKHCKIIILKINFKILTQFFYWMSTLDSAVTFCFKNGYTDHVHCKKNTNLKNSSVYRKTYFLQCKKLNQSFFLYRSLLWGLNLHFFQLSCF